MLRISAIVIAIFAAIRLIDPSPAAAIMECPKEDIVAKLNIDNVKCSGDCANLRIETLNTEGIKFDQAKMRDSAKEVSSNCSAKSKKNCRTFQILHDSVCRNNPLQVQWLSMQPNKKTRGHVEQILQEELDSSKHWRFIDTYNNTIVSFDLTIMQN